MEPHHEVKLTEVLHPAGLPAIKDLGSREILQILVVCNNVDRLRGAIEIILPDAEGIEVMPPDAEGIKDSKGFLVMHVVVEFGGVKQAGVKSDQVNFSVV